MENIENIKKYTEKNNVQILPPASLHGLLFIFLNKNINSNPCRDAGGKFHTFLAYTFIN